jgi:hypothetical protein
LENKYVTYIITNGQENLTEITKDQFDNIKTAKENLVNLLYIEDKFNFIVENFFELEHDILKVTLNKVYFPNYTVDWSLSVSDIHLINRRLINLLTTTKLYLDQITHDINMITHGIPELTELIKKTTNYHYDNVLGYRVMEALRNYVQHRGLPVHVLSYNSKRIDENQLEGNIETEHSISPMIRLDDLERDGKFKRTVLNELKQLGENKINLKNNTREYIESLFQIQKFLRDTLNVDVQKWETIINNAISIHTSKYSDVKMIVIGEQLPNGFITNRLYLTSEYIIRRKSLETKNSNLSNISRKIITTDV